MNNVFRVGIGVDSHGFSKSKRPLVLGGVEVSKTGGLEGKSDADVILHSLCNAISSAIGGDSLSTWSDAMCKKGITDSREYLRHIAGRASEKKYQVVNVSVSVEAKKPRVDLETIKKMKAEIAEILSIASDCVGITFTSGEGLTAFGKGLGIQAISQVLLCQKQ
ncbi:MAG: 2-C-methyl-D-erythritol 2,4-cyclodiphosphate synthase [Candidatus Curtissbacteria bacterium GW2011_GWA1_40_16]|uniref:2-C-methyl-D-erythritol 2,4-cyclodiphosphate synthase n=1 Tax=Candidatus Curtissbacteria bacterium GW2011_GWA1_40_16 TaxID=1618405 RepID=A0A0G0RJY8_9BACT|nr:MAG: 2-C-methyl-D-erythritol 2,4-cyclodiphosphate synthase [Candidatus Curtissbacteria bacterium GW2011_GWA1_40_16]